MLGGLGNSKITQRPPCGSFHKMGGSYWRIPAINGPCNCSEAAAGSRVLLSVGREQFIQNNGAMRGFCACLGDPRPPCQNPIWTLAAPVSVADAIDLRISSIPREPNLA